MPPKVACQLHVRIGEEQSSLPFPLCTQLARVGMWCLLLRVTTVVAQCIIFPLLIVAYLLVVEWASGKNAADAGPFFVGLLLA